ncbi:MAG TPA: dTDP-glucose 4,6-dehydratase, partial [Gaiella sp.]|nr:dTDP-glucose 4,6-dehydratase [Gaiella sp.]
MRVLVTGGAGFIGSHFVRRLVEGGDDVVVLDKLTYAGNPANLDSGIELLVGDIADPDAVERAAKGCDAVVNFAAETHVDRSILGPQEFVHTDVLGTMTLLEWARANDARYVQVSTDEVYGDLEAGGRALEDDPLRPSSPYSAAKAGGDLQVLAYVRTYGVRASITRGANTFGPNQYPEKLVPLFVTNALAGEALPVYGDGKQVREWLHAEDHCAGVELVLREGAPGEIYNIGGEDHENLEVTHRILELTGADPSLIRHVEDRAGHDRRYALDD